MRSHVEIRYGTNFVNISLSTSYANFSDYVQIRGKMYFGTQSVIFDFL